MLRERQKEGEDGQEVEAAGESYAVDALALVVVVRFLKERVKVVDVHPVPQCTLVGIQATHLSCRRLMEGLGLRPRVRTDF